jgi:hypothetical protein
LERENGGELVLVILLPNMKMKYHNSHRFELFFLLVLLCCSGTVFPQKSKLAFDTADFFKKTELADWLVRYDTVAWHSSDIAMAEDKKDIARLGSEWFCFEDSKGVWHAVYGKYADGKYDTVFHYIVDNAGKIVRTNAPIDQDFANTHANALITANIALARKVKRGSPRFNQYIRQNADKTFDVWLFPAFQPDGTAVFGGEGIYLIDKSGSKIISDTSYFQPEFRGFKTGQPREIWLNYQELEKPTLGSVFFVWYYKAYFTNIYIDNAKSTSTAIKGENGQYLWATVEKDLKKAPKLK